MPRRVVLDGRVLRRDSGIGQYCYGLARALPRAAPDLDLELLLPPGDDPLVRDLEARPEGLRIVRCRPGAASPVATLEIALGLLRRGRVVYHCPDWPGVPSLPGGFRTLLTIHDLIPLVAREGVPRSFKARHPRLYRGALRVAAHGAAAILTDTAYWKGEIVTRLGVEASRVHVVPLGVTLPRPPGAEARTKTLARLGLEGCEYLLAVGRPEPYKGLVELVRAFARVRRRERLVVVGSMDPRYPEAREEARALGLGEAALFTGPVESEELEALYAGARAFATLSRLEGFGLPPLEAMARGIPVLAADQPVHREVLGDAALLADPERPEQVEAALARVLRDEPTRASLVRAGRERAARYTWEACARATADVYRQLLG